MKKFLIMFLFFAVNTFSQSYIAENAFPNLNFKLPTEIIEKNGKIYVSQLHSSIDVFDNNSLVQNKKVFIDLRNNIYHDLDTISGGEGLIGFAFHPNYNTNGYVFISYCYSITVETRRINHIVLSRFSRSPINQDSLLNSSEQIFYDIECEKRGHNGGTVAFDSDGYLRVGVGDDSWDNDTEPDRGYKAQDLRLPFGKIFRINVDVPSNGRRYSIPNTNPFYQNQQGYLEEIYAYGFRNPYKFSFRNNGEMWLGDVGEQFWEEVDKVELGKNYGWNKMEGFHCFSYPFPIVCDTTGRNLTRPIFEYSHSIGQTIVGGYFYYGILFPELYGKYIYGDFIQGKIWAYDENTNTSQLIHDSTFKITTFGIDNNNELLFTDYFSGKIMKLKPSNFKLNLNVLLEGPKEKSDSITIYLRNQFAPFQLIDSSKALLENGNCVVNFNNIYNNYGYYLVIRNRNSIETWSATPQIFLNNILNYQFSSKEKAYGNNLKEINNKFYIYTGDVNQDGIVDLTDLTMVKNDANEFFQGDFITDLNKDSIINLSDILLVYNNTSILVTVKKPINDNKDLIEKENDISNFEIFPNPIKDKTYIKFDLNENKNTKIEIYNILGKKVYTLLNENLNTGTHIINLNKDFSSGIYYCIIKTNNFIITKKLLIVK